MVLRFNIVKSRTEYRVIHASGLYQPVTKFALNSFRRKLDVTAGVATSAENIRMILESDFVSKVHPIREYLTALPLLNPAGHGYIKKLLNTVQVANPGKWEEYFTKWLVGVVANAMNDDWLIQTGSMYNPVFCSAFHNIKPEVVQGIKQPFDALVLG